MSKRQIIKELALEVETARRDYKTVVEQRDESEKRHEWRDSVNRHNAAAKREAAIQEKVDGIRAGLIPVSELRKAFDGLTVESDGSVFINYRFAPGRDRIEKAISDALTTKPEEKYAEGGYTGIDIDSVKYVDGGYIPRYFNPGMTANSQRVNGSFLGNWAA